MQNRAAEDQEIIVKATPLILFLLVSPLLADTTLSPAKTNVLGPYRPAVLELTNDSAATIEHISLQWELGGPTVETAALIPPSQSRTIKLLLPAMAKEQTFRLQLGDAPAVEITIIWPDGWADRAAFFAPKLYHKYADQALRRDLSRRANILLILSFGVLGLITTCFLRRSEFRIAFCVLILLATTLSIATRFCAETTIYALELPDARLALFSVTRTQTVEPNEFTNHPLYANRAHLAGDDLRLTIRDGKLIDAVLTLRPGEIRLFRRAASK